MEKKHTSWMVVAPAWAVLGIPLAIDATYEHANATHMSPEAAATWNNPRDPGSEAHRNIQAIQAAICLASAVGCAVVGSIKPKQKEAHPSQRATNS